MPAEKGRTILNISNSNTQHQDFSKSFVCPINAIHARKISTTPFAVDIK
jgi:hypothetical protein